MSKRADPLAPYRGKRDPERTPEPFGGGGVVASPRGTTRFVIQLHRARRLHYDFRIEHGGVLKSWAIPKGLPGERGERRLAVEVEDHPVEYGTFEGVIPAGNYGAGAVILWDLGTLRSREEITTSLERGTLEFELDGYKLCGTYVLVRPKRGEKSWLVIAKGDARRRGVSEDAGARSVFSGRTVEELASGGSRLGGVEDELRARAVPERSIPPAERRPMLAAAAPAPFDTPGWIFEIKYDGVRLLAARSGESVRLLTRVGRDVAARFPELLPPLRALPADPYVLDGELISTDAEGRMSLGALQQRLTLTNPRDIARQAGTRPAQLIAFDCLAVAGFDCRALPLLARKGLLRRLVPTVGPVSYCDHFEADGTAVYEAAVARGLEGIVAKRRDSVYVAGRSSQWLKVRCEQREDFVVGGYTRGRGSARILGAVLVGQYDGAALVYAGRVGTGFGAEVLERLTRDLASLETAEPPFADPPHEPGVRWVRPQLVCEVGFAEWTSRGVLRHPRLIALRSDKAPLDCRRMAVTSVDSAAPRGTAGVSAARVTHGRASASLPRRDQGRSEGPGPVRFSNLDKVLWPDDGYTKGDLVAYYRRVAPLLLPYLRDRPVVLTRYPDGITGQSFYQKDAPEWVPEGIHRVRLYTKEGEREIDYFVCNDLSTLLYIANMACIPIHVWSSRVEHPDRPDWMVLDLDPGEAPFAAVVTVARGLYRLLRGIGLRTFVKTSGSTGLHLLVPLGARYPHGDVKQFAELVARLGAGQMDELATVERRPARRQSKVYIDYLQNGHGKTIAAPYAVRARPGAPVSAPLRWSQVTSRLRPDAWTIRTLPGRIATSRDDPLRPVLRAESDLEAALRKLERRFRPGTGSG